MHSYDVIMLVLLAATTVFGAWKGMAWQVASLASLVVSAGVAVHFSKPIAPVFGSSGPWNRFAAMLVLYLATSLIVWMLFRFVAGMIDRVRLREFDRQVGALFGLTKGVLLCLVVTFFAVTLSQGARQAVLQSRSGGYIARLIRRADPIIPSEVRAVLGTYIDELDRQLDPDTPPEPKTLDRLVTEKSEADRRDTEPDAAGRVDPERLLDAVRDSVLSPGRDRAEGETEESG